MFIPVLTMVAVAACLPSTEPELLPEETYLMDAALPPVTGASTGDADSIIVVGSVAGPVSAAGGAARSELRKLDELEWY